jgi:hypothetical protein
MIELLLCCFRHHLLFIAFISFSFRLSALAFCKDNTAHIAAGSHPIRVICKIKQIIAEKIFPRRKNDIEGKNIAINVMSWVN